MLHYSHKVQGWCYYTRLLDAIVADCSPDEQSTVVEIGVWKGRSTAYLGVAAINSKKPILHIAVDWFKGSDEAEHHADPDLKNLRQVFDKNTRPLVEQTESDKYEFAVYPFDSVHAAEAFADESVDYVIVDGAHTYEGVKRDLRAWFPKVKTGGVIGGDDWNWDAVRLAVNEFARSRDLTVHVGNANVYPYYYFIVNR